MEIKICSTNAWSQREWQSFVSGFDEVFQKHFTKEYFETKYCSNFVGSSFHALLLNNNNDVVGNVSIIPCQYQQNDREIIAVGLAVDVFILEAYRSDPLMLRRMYNKLKEYVKLQGIVAVLAVPNKTAYPYWKNVVKWQDVGHIPYWGIPVKVGNIVRKGKILNVCSWLYANVVLGFAAVCSKFSNKSQAIASYTIRDDKNFLTGRFGGNDYVWVSRPQSVNCFRIVDEEGVRTAYLIYSRQGRSMTFKSLCDGVSAILKEGNVDLILYIGPIRLFQTLFVHIPRKWEPKQLPLVCDLLDNNEVYKNMLAWEHWDFGLLNYDVR